MRTSTRRRTLVALLVLLVAALTGAAISPVVARAATPVRLSLDPGGGPVGATVTAHGTGFTPGETVDLRWDTFVWASATVDAGGSAGVRFTVPGTAAGVHQVWMTGRTGGRTAGTPFAVREDWAQVGGGPGHTGSAVHAPDLDRFGLDWSWELGNDAGPGLGAVVADGMVYATTARGDVSSLTTRGAFRWSTTSASRSQVRRPSRVTGSWSCSATGSCRASTS